MPELCAVASRAHSMRSCTSVGKFLLAADIFQANVVLVERGDFRLQIAAEQSHQKSDFALGPLLPVLFGERVERERRNVNARRGLDRRAHGGNAGAMPGHARHVAAFGPAPVAVHDDGDVPGEPRRIETPVDFGFLAVEPRRYLQSYWECYFVVQSGHRMRLPQQGRVSNDWRDNVARALPSAWLRALSSASLRADSARECRRDGNRVGTAALRRPGS